MNDIHERLDALARRVEVLEAARRQYRRVAVGLAVAVVAVGTVAARPAGEKEMELTKLVVREPGGKSALILEAQKEVVNIRLVGSDEKNRAVLATNPDGQTVFVLRSGNAKYRWTSVVTNDSVLAGSEVGKRRVYTFLDEDEAAVGFVDSNGKNRLSLELNKTGEPQIAFSDAAGKSKLNVEYREKTGPSLDLFNATGNLVTTICTDKNGGGQVGLMNADGKVVFTAPSK
jgi:hypothetical protein